MGTETMNEKDMIDHMTGLIRGMTSMTSMITVRAVMTDMTEDTNMVMGKTRNPIKQTTNRKSDITYGGSVLFNVL